MKTIAVVIGHGPLRDKGAENANGTTELEWNTDLSYRIRAHMGARANVVIVHRVIERLQPVTETNETGADIAVELHLNSYDGSASGTETIHHPRSANGKRLAEILCRRAVAVLGLPNRGAKPPFAGRGLRWLQGTRMPAVIVESFFVDNDADLERGNARKEALAEAYCNAFLEYLA